MQDDIIIQVTGRAGGLITLKVVPELIPGVNNRFSITGKFGLFVLIDPKPAKAPVSIHGTTQMSFVGNIRFMNENFFEWQYDGDSLAGSEVSQIVSIIQEQVEVWLSWLEHQPPSSDHALGDPEDALLSDEQLEELKRHPLYHIAPYFTFGPDDDFVAIIQNGANYDIHINGEVTAVLDDETDPQVVTGVIKIPGLLPEIIRRVKAIRAL